MSANVVPAADDAKNSQRQFCMSTAPQSDALPVDLHWRQDIISLWVVQVISTR